jgi:hypothetical protein
VHTAFLLVATTCLAGSVPGWGYWDGGYGDDGYCAPCGYSYGYPSYGYDCYDAWSGPCCYPCCWGPCWSACCNPCWVPHPTCCNPHDNCLDRLRCRLHNKHEPPPPPCWGWDPSGGGPCFQGGSGPYSNCGWGSVQGAAQASGTWCPDDCCPNSCCKHAHCLKRLCERWRCKHGGHAACFDPCAGPWDACPDDSYGGPPVGW